MASHCSHHQNSCQESQGPGHLPASSSLCPLLTRSSHRHLFFWPSSTLSWFGPLFALVPSPGMLFPQAPSSHPKCWGPDPQLQRSPPHIVTLPWLISFPALTSPSDYILSTSFEVFENGSWLLSCCPVPARVPGTEWAPNSSLWSQQISVRVKCQKISISWWKSDQ